MSVKTKVCETCDKLSNLPIIGGILKPKPRVSILRLSGVIADSGPGRGGISHHKYEKFITDAFDEFDLQAVLLVINSPGGSPAQSALIGDQIRRLSEEKEVPVYAFVEDVAASGGYWLAAAADEIYANETSIVGSIGVISAGFGFKDLINKYGVERRVHTSGKNKSFLDPFTEEKPADLKRLKAIQGELHETFIRWVKERRGKKLKGKDEELFDGSFWSAKTALELGLVDGFGEAKRFAKTKFGEEIKFVELGPERKLVSSLLGSGMKSSLAEDAIEALETKAVWSRYGL
ncbi:MAG TPA: S49 family peptidase [Alphaproteobacteria bacterium]|nr:S49 family peptidase [Alphaproteobacteria bacterium]USO04917.1 MAG: S49 family peptidase [Rhodospirillales bacterium]HOO82574.1 S49 family peptidase [Alphaproteobacteria bacterium]